VIEPLRRVAGNPIVHPSHIAWMPVTGAFNPGACVDVRTNRVVLLVRLYERDTGRSCLGLALSNDGEHIDEVRDGPAIGREAPYESWGVEDARVTWLTEDERYAITYTGYSPQGPRVCLITASDILDPATYVRHGPRIAGENKNCVVFPRRVGGQYVVLHRPMPRMVCIRVQTLEEEWPVSGTAVVGPRAGTWRSSRVGAGAPPIETEIGWLLPFHGATSIEEGNIYSMGWCVLESEAPERVRYVSPTPALSPEAPYEIELGRIPQVDPANFRTGIRVVFPQGMVERGDDLIVYYGAADVSIGAARVNKAALVASLKAAIADGQGAEPL